MTVLYFENLFHAHDRAGVCKRIDNRYAASFILTLCGRIRFTGAEGSFVTDAKSALFIPQGWSYENACEEDAESYTFNFRTLEENLHPTPLPRPEEQLCTGAYMRIRQALLRPENRYRVLGELYLLTQALCPVPVKSPAEEWVEGSLSFFRERYADPELRVEDAAAVQHISPVYLYRLFQERLGRSPFACLTEIRMQQAEVLLRERMPVGETALAVGYRDTPQFSRAYRRYYGHSPRHDEG